MVDEGVGDQVVFDGRASFPARLVFFVWTFFLHAFAIVWMPAGLWGLGLFGLSGRALALDAVCLGFWAFTLIKSYREKGDEVYEQPLVSHGMLSLVRRRYNASPFGRRMVIPLSDVSGVEKRCRSLGRPLDIPHVDISLEVPSNTGRRQRLTVEVTRLGYESSERRAEELRLALVAGSVACGPEAGAPPAPSTVAPPAGDGTPSASETAGPGRLVVPERRPLEHQPVGNPPGEQAGVRPESGPSPVSPPTSSSGVDVPQLPVPSVAAPATRLRWVGGRWRRVAFAANDGKTAEWGVRTVARRFSNLFIGLCLLATALLWILLALSGVELSKVAFFGGGVPPALVCAIFIVWRDRSAWVVTADDIVKGGYVVAFDSVVRIELLPPMGRYSKDQVSYVYVRVVHLRDNGTPDYLYLPVPIPPVPLPGPGPGEYPTEISVARSLSSPLAWRIANYVNARINEHGGPAALPAGWDTSVPGRVGFERPLPTTPPPYRPS